MFDDTLGPTDIVNRLDARTSTKGLKSQVRDRPWSLRPKKVNTDGITRLRPSPSNPAHPPAKRLRRNAGPPRASRSLYTVPTFSVVMPLQRNHWLLRNVLALMFPPRPVGRPSRTFHWFHWLTLI